MFVETVLPTDGPHVFQVTGALALLGYCDVQQLVNFDSTGAVTNAVKLLKVSVGLCTGTPSQALNVMQLGRLSFRPGCNQLSV